MITIKLDPLNKFPHLRKRDILESLGYISYWASVADDYNNFKECLLSPEHYGSLYGGESHGGKITEEGYFIYPGDPDLPPIAMWATDDEIMYQYKGAIVAVVNITTNEQWITRMD